MAAIRRSLVCSFNGKETVRRDFVSISRARSYFGGLESLEWIRLVVFERIQSRQKDGLSFIDYKCYMLQGPCMVMMP